MQRAPDALGVICSAKPTPRRPPQCSPRSRAEAARGCSACWFAQIAAELQALLLYPADSAGRIMDPRITPVRGDATVGEALTRLRSVRRKTLRELFVVDGEGRLSGRIEIQELAVAEEDTPLRELTRPLVATVRDIDPREDVAAILQHHPMSPNCP